MKKTVFNKVVKKLCNPTSYKKVFHRNNHDVPMPSVAKLEVCIDLLKQILFPGYFGAPDVKPETIEYYTGSTLDQLHRLLSTQIKYGYCFSCETKSENKCKRCESKSQIVAEKFFMKLPEIRRLLSTDVTAAYEGDPAAKTPGETVFCYPSIIALTNYRIAHELYKLKVPIIPRIITEMAHSETGIDIHPGATIDENFFMDHGTGIVIGETTIIGKKVRIYQGVTLGAKSFPKDKNGRLVKGIARHPIIEDNAIIYSGTTILGRVRIGKNSILGGNVWLTEDVPPNSRVMQISPTETNISKIKRK